MNISILPGVACLRPFATLTLCTLISMGAATAAAPLESRTAQMPGGGSPFGDTGTAEARPNSNHVCGPDDPGFFGTGARACIDKNGTSPGMHTYYLLCTVSGMLCCHARPNGSTGTCTSVSAVTDFSGSNAPGTLPTLGSDPPGNPLTGPGGTNKLQSR
jgi:hypothetical protein